MANSPFPAAQRLGWPEIASGINSLCAEQRVGLVMVRGEAGTAQMYVAGGTLQGITFGSQRGLEALRSLSATNGGVASFINDLRCSKPDEFPSLSRTLAVLSGGTTSEVPAAGAVGTPSSEAASVQAVSAVGLDGRSRAELTRLLAERVGPMAKVMCDQIPEGTPVEAAIEQIAGQLTARLNDDAFAREFSAKARAVLG